MTKIDIFDNLDRISADELLKHIQEKVVTYQELLVQDDVVLPQKTSDEMKQRILDNASSYPKEDIVLFIQQQLIAVNDLNNKISSEKIEKIKEVLTPRNGGTNPKIDSKKKDDRTNSEKTDGPSLNSQQRIKALIIILFTLLFLLVLYILCLYSKIGKVESEKESEKERYESMCDSLISEKDSLFKKNDSLRQIIQKAEEAMSKQVVTIKDKDELIKDLNVQLMAKKNEKDSLIKANRSISSYKSEYWNWLFKIYQNQPVIIENVAFISDTRIQISYISPIFSGSDVELTAQPVNTKPGRKYSFVLHPNRSRSVVTEDVEIKNLNCKRGYRLKIFFKNEHILFDKVRK